MSRKRKTDEELLKELEKKIEQDKMPLSSQEYLTYELQLRVGNPIQALYFHNIEVDGSLDFVYNLGDIRDKDMAGDKLIKSSEKFYRILIFCLLKSSPVVIDFYGKRI